MDVISYRSASTRIRGEYLPSGEAAKYTWGNHGQNNLPTRTVVEARLCGLRIDLPQEDERRAPGFDRRWVEIDDMQFLMESSCDRRTPNAFRTMTASFGKVMVDGRELIVETNTGLFTDHYTKRRLDAALEDSDFAARASNQIVYHDSGGTLGTIVTGLRRGGEAPDLTRITSNRLTVEGFGSIYFGEIVVQEGMRRLTMARFQLGSPQGGTVSACGGQQNGVGVPPMSGG